MDADYSVELGPEAPALEIPWHDPEGRLHYVELRSDSGSMDRDILNDPRLNDVLLNVARIPEARQFPALGRFLIAVNSAESQWQSAKCDVWPAPTSGVPSDGTYPPCVSSSEEAEAAENLYNRGFEQSCYVDIVLAGQAAELRFSLEVHERLARELAQLLEANAALEATAEIVVRRCYFHPDGEAEESDAGYCLTLFLAAYGSSQAEAAACWDCAMDFASGCVLKLRPREVRAKSQELS